MIKKILLGLLIAIVVVVTSLVIAASTQPDDFRYSRSLTMNAPAAVVFEQVNNLKKSEQWSPWAKLDPNMKVTYEGPEAGTGAKYSWAGNAQVGEGRMTIVESKPNELVKTQLDFIKPFQGTNMAEFALKPEGSQTTVTWSMYGKNNFIGKCMGLFMNCEKMIGDEFDKGLASMKAIVESKPQS